MYYETNNGHRDLVMQRNHFQHSRSMSGFAAAVPGGPCELHRHQRNLLPLGSYHSMNANRLRFEEAQGAFPAIFPASATLVEKTKRKRRNAPASKALFVAASRTRCGGSRARLYTSCRIRAYRLPAYGPPMRPGWFLAAPVFCGWGFRPLLTKSVDLSKDDSKFYYRHSEPPSQSGGSSAAACNT
jgi:hypothetical protein